jgi:hypothetical protein
LITTGKLKKFIPENYLIKIRNFGVRVMVFNATLEKRKVYKSEGKGNV